MADYYNQSLHRVKSQLHGTFEFIMRNYANPPANYTWSKDNVVFPPDAHMDVSSGNLGMSILSKYNVGVEDFGTYLLNMSNAYGSDIRYYELIPIGK